MQAVLGSFARFCTQIRDTIYMKRGVCSKVLARLHLKSHMILHWTRMKWIHLIDRSSLSSFFPRKLQRLAYILPLTPSKFASYLLSVLPPYSPNLQDLGERRQHALRQLHTRPVLPFQEMHNTMNCVAIHPACCQSFGSWFNWLQSGSCTRYIATSWLKLLRLE
jgi:hypothetical protein